ncbi:MAG: phosphatidylserine/phosphatidylglycerophosphate/cardiolipin synthase family protein [Oscillospiraceae bacterium]
MKKITRYLLLALLAAAVYIIVAALAPFFRHMISSGGFDPVSCYGIASSSDKAGVISDNEDALSERLRMISQASDRIIMSTFDFRDDESGRQVLSALLDASDRGVKVNILVDGLSGFTHMEGSKWFYALSAQDNVEIRIYNPVNPLKPWKLMARMHDKYLIADDSAFMLGGRNTNDLFLGDQEGQNYDWDVLIDCRPDSDALTQLMCYFQSVWECSDSRVFHNSPQLLERGSVSRAAEELRKLYLQLLQDSPELLSPSEIEMFPVSKITLLSNPINAGNKSPEVFDSLISLISSAEGPTTLHTPYIICNDYMMQQLCGVSDKLTIMTNSAANNKNLFGASDYLAHKEDLVNTGISLLEYDSGQSYHGKCALIDGRLCVIGSFNLDMRSTYVDTELMLVIDSPQLAVKLREEMAVYEDVSLSVIDAENSISPDGTVPQRLSPGRRILLSSIRLLIGWSRFIM